VCWLDSVFSLEKKHFWPLTVQEIGGQKGGLFSLFFRGFVLPETVLGFAGVCMDNHRNQASLCSALNLVYNCYGLN
jgi:hypothetical protein